MKTPREIAEREALDTQRVRHRVEVSLLKEKVAVLEAKLEITRKAFERIQYGTVFTQEAHGHIDIARAALKEIER